MDAAALSIDDLSKAEIYQQQNLTTFIHPVWTRLRESGATDLDWQTWKGLALSGAFADEVYAEIQSRFETVRKASAAESRKEFAINSLVGTHHDYLTIERMQGGLTSDSAATFDIYVITSPYNEDLADRLRKVGAKFSAKVWRIKTEKHSALKKIINDLPDMIGLQQLRDTDEVAEVKAFCGVHHSYLTIRASQSSRTITIESPFNRHLVHRMRATDAHWDSARKVWVLAWSKRDGLPAILRDLPSLIEMEARDEAQVRQARQESQSREQAQFEEAGRIERERIAQERRERDDRDGRIYRTERNVWQGYMLDQEMVRDGVVYRLESGVEQGPEYGHDGDWMVSGSYVPASEDRQQEYRRQIEQRERVNEAESTVQLLRRRVIEHNDRPRPAEVAGDCLLDTLTIVGSGDCWYIDTEWIWYVEAHGMDGDDWSANNAPGSVAWRIPFDEEIAQVLRNAASIINQ